jgi:nucleoside-diphosphate-sugar epimerase
MGDKKILLTGGAGYIGIVLLQKLIAKGYKVRVLDNFLFGKKPIKPFLNKIEIVNKDIRKVSEKDVDGIDAVIHLAGLSNDPMADFDPKANLEINTVGTVRLAKICKEQGIKRFTFASSASIYNRGILKRTRIQKESGIVRPKAAYSVSKYKAESELMKMTDKSFAPIIFRQGTVYGFSPRMRYDLVVNTMVKTALSEGKIYVFCGGVQWRPLVDVDDVAVAHIKALEIPEKKLKGEIINLFYENDKILDVAHMVKTTVEESTGKPIELVIDHSPKKDRSYRISNSKVERILGWRPKISIEESVRNMLKQIINYKMTNFKNDNYYNIRKFKLP